MAAARLASADGSTRASPRWLAGYGLSPELGAYLGEVLHSSWPRLRWDLSDDVDALQRWQVDAWLVVGLPPVATPRPLLWIRGPARGPRWYRLSPRRWCMPAPVLAEPLRACVHDIIIAARTA